MVDSLLDFYKSISGFDLIYLIITVWSLIKCSSKGFVLSILSASKWLLAYVVTLILFPKIKPYVKDVIDNQYVLELVLGAGIFVVVIFLILIIIRDTASEIKIIPIISLKPAIAWLNAPKLLIENSSVKINSWIE